MITPFSARAAWQARACATGTTGSTLDDAGFADIPTVDEMVRSTSTAVLACSPT